jgi:uncharacterized protein (UPF0276 family)
MSDLRARSLAFTARTAIGIGLRPPHIGELLSGAVAVDFLEVLTDNFLTPAAAARRVLQDLARHYPLVLHGVGLNLLGPDRPNQRYIDQVARLADQVDAPWVSDHLCWTAAFGHEHHDLLPFPTSSLLVEWLAERAAGVQRRIGRPLALENLSTYLPVRGGDMDDLALLVAVAQQAECKILLDINNIYVSAMNAGRDPLAQLEHVDWTRVAHVHLAGHVEQGDGVRVDTHDQPVSESVWNLYQHAWLRGGPQVTLIEWDAAIPPLDRLLGEVQRAQQVRSVSPHTETPHTVTLAEVSHVQRARKDIRLSQPGAPPDQRPATRVDLLDWQHALTDHLRTPLAAQHGQLRPQPGEAALLSWVDLPTELAQARLAVYQRQVWLRHFSILQAELPTVAHLLGLWTFNRLAEAYLLDFPPVDADLHQLVERWPAFLAGRTEGAQALPQGGHVTRELLAEASHFDLAHRGVLAAPVEPVLTADAAQLRNPHREPWPLHPACAIVWAHPAMATLRQTALHRQDESPLAAPPHAAPVPWLIQATDQTVEARSIAPLHARLYTLLTQSPLASALAQLQKAHPELASDHLAQAVQAAMRDGLISQVWRQRA